MFATGCVNTRFLQEDEILFKANKVELQSPEEIKKERQFRKEIASISQLQPNKKFLGMSKTRLWFYNVSNRRKPNKFRYWMKNKVGEAPVFYEPSLAAKSTALMQNYLINKGYFYTDVQYTSEIKKKKATVTYYVDTKNLYRVKSVNFPKDSGRINGIINDNKENSHLKPGEPFDVSLLKKERERIADDLRNRGYYYFNKEYVYFDLDSNKAKQKLDVFVRIDLPQDSALYQRYYINNIYVVTDFSVEQLKTSVDHDTVQVGEYFFISQKLKYRPKILISAIHLKKEELYSKKAHSSTINHMVDLGVFKYVDVKFVKASRKGKNYLNCLINLSPAKRQEISAETELNNNTDYDLGVSVTLGYRNRNIFRGTELFSISASAGFESNLERNEQFFNTVDLNVGFDLYFNQFIAPFRLKNVPKQTRPKTRISLRNEYLRRIDYYTTNSASLTFGYDWRGSRTVRNLLNPIVINLVRNFEATQQFLDVVEKSQSLKNSFTEQLILGAEYNFIWSNQATTDNRSFFYYRGGIDFSGNILHGIMSLAHINDSEEPPYQLFNVDYAQYFRVTSDLRNYLKVTRNSSFVTRILGGIGIPYGNSESLVYIKQFFAGGANSMRAWSIRTLGPGAFNYRESEVLGEDDDFFFDQTGEMKIEANAEYRFDIFKFFKGALFVDVGNIWTLESDTLRPEANFDITRFWNEFAIGAGIGFRLDFSYFVFRLDVGLKFRDPAFDKKWIVKDFRWERDIRQENLKWNLAIGYPF